MPPKVKVSKKKMNAMPGISELMNSLSALTEDPDNLSNCYEVLNKFKKYEELIHLFNECLIRLDIYLSKNNCYIKGLRELRDITVSELKEYKSVEVSKIDKYLDINSAPKDILKKLKLVYYKMAKSSNLKAIIKMGTNIKKGHIYSDIKKKVDDEVKTIPGMTFERYLLKCRSKDVSLDLMNNIAYTSKYSDKFSGMEEVSDLCEYIARYSEETIPIFNLLKKINKIGKETYKTRNIPEIDISVIHVQIVKILKSFKNEVGGHASGFKYIENSEEIFTKNFDKYFKHMNTSGDPTTFFTDFIEDVVSNISEDATMSDIYEVKNIATQLKKVIMKKMGGKINTKLGATVSSAINTMDELFNTYVNVDGLETTSQTEADDLMKQFNSKFGI